MVPARSAAIDAAEENAIAEAESVKKEREQADGMLQLSHGRMSILRFDLPVWNRLRQARDEGVPVDLILAMETVGKREQEVLNQSDLASAIDRIKRRTPAERPTSRGARRSGGQSEAGS